MTFICQKLVSFSNLTRHSIINSVKYNHYQKSHRIHLSNMPTVDIYFMPESPPCRAIEMVANIAGVTLNKRPINLFTGEHKKDEYLKINPLGKIPFLVDGDLRIAESRAIMAYLVNKYMPEDNTLYPRDPVQRARVDELLYLDMGTLFFSAAKLFRPVLIGISKTLDSESEQAFRANLEYFDKRLESNVGKKFFIGDDLTIADISMAGSFTFISGFDYDLSTFKSLTAYLGRLRSSIPKYAEINDGPTENLRKFVKSK